MQSYAFNTDSLIWLSKRYKELKTLFRIIFPGRWRECTIQRWMGICRRYGASVYIYVTKMEEYDVKEDSRIWGYPEDMLLIYEKLTLYFLWRTLSFKRAKSRHRYYCMWIIDFPMLYTFSLCGWKRADDEW